MSTATTVEDGQSKSFLMNQRAEEQEKVAKQLIEKKAEPGLTPEVKKTPNKPSTSGGKIAVVLVRGLVKLTQPVKDTLQMLRLTRKNNAIILHDNPVNKGMLQKVKDYVTWGEITDEVFTQLVEKRGEELKSRVTDKHNKYSYKVLEVNGKKYKPYFRLSPPKKGFGRKGIKIPFKVGGGLGYRGEKMSDLIQRML